MLRVRFQYSLWGTLSGRRGWDMPWRCSGYELWIMGYISGMQITNIQVLRFVPAFVSGSLLLIHLTPETLNFFVSGTAPLSSVDHCCVKALKP